jgi:glucokinase
MAPSADPSTMGPVTNAFSGGNLKGKQMILAGDIGGTNTRLGLFTREGERMASVRTRTYPSREHERLDDIVDQFTAEHDQRVTAACFAIAGPVSEGRVATTNLAWLVDSERLAYRLGLAAMHLINDLEAIGHGLAELAPADIAVLAPGNADAHGNRAIIAAGTGLGEAGCYWDGRAHHPFACEGGHADFAPRDELEIELLRHLRTRFDRVSYERVVSGVGLFELYKFLHHTGRGAEDAALTETIYQQAHPAPIVRAAADGRSERCAMALDRFVSLYGAEAGNLGLKLMARGGIFIGGGIAPRIIDRLRQPAFLAALTGKGRMKPLLESMPVHVILNDKAGLLGAARYADARKEG